MGHAINIKGRLLNLEKPVVMGIINVTPDSFFEESRVTSEQQALETAHNFLNDGAAILDIGAQSTRPGAERITEDEEKRRILPVIKAITAKFPDAVISVDTFYSGVAKDAIEEGASIVNDVSAGSIDPQMFQTVADLHVPYVLMHMKGSPKDMHLHPQYDNVMTDLMRFFSEKLRELRNLGVNDIIIDPGFGFGKNLNHNYEILHSLSEFQMFGVPVLAGLSRKKMIQKVIGEDAANSLNGTTAANMLALINGAVILRVHDVKEAAEACKIFNAFKNPNKLI